MKSSHDLRLQKQQNKQQCKDMDETDLFFLSMSKAIKKLPKLEQSKIKLDLHSAISQAEIRLLEAQNQVRKTPINVTHHIISPPQQQKLQSDVHTSTSMLSYPRRGATQLSWSRSSTICSTVSTTPAPTTSTGVAKKLRTAVSRDSDHHSFWEKAIATINKIKYVDSHGKMSSVRNLNNWITTLRSFQRLCILGRHRNFFRPDALLKLQE